MKALFKICLKVASKVRFRRPRNEEDIQNNNYIKKIEESSKSHCTCPTQLVYAEDKYTLSTKGWFWPYLSGPVAENVLRDCDDGSFLIRKSSTAGFAFTITYKVHGRVGNLRVQCKDGLFCLNFSDPVQPREPTLQRLIGNLLHISKKGSICELKRQKEGKTEAIPLKLEKPLQRNITLQDHCRSVIMRNIRDSEQVRQFQLPIEVKDFLLEMKDEP